MFVSFGQLEGLPTVVADGRLNLRTAPLLRDALLKASAEQPPALVCDLRRASADAHALTVLLTVADTVQTWPAMPLVLLTGEPSMATRLAGTGVSRRLPVAHHPQELAELIRRSPGRLQSSSPLPATADAPALARGLVARTLRRWHVGRHLDAAELIADELVTNAVVHTGRPCALRLSLTGTRLGVSVADGGAPASPEHHRPHRSEGRGLVLVERLSDHWGVFPRVEGGHVTWAVLGGRGSRFPAVPSQSTQHA